jgi:hypothetical protein
MQSRTERQSPIGSAAEPKRLSGEAPICRGIDPGAHPVVAELHDIAGRLVEILGPMFWAALIALFLWAAANKAHFACENPDAVTPGSAPCSAPAAPAAIAGDSRPPVR